MISYFKNSIQNRKRSHLSYFLFHISLKLSFFFFLFPFSFFILTCSQSTDSNNKVTFSGTVTLEGVEDFSGVTVSLYKPVVLDTALVRINQQYPNIGVQISQETEFDHRENTPIASTTTNADGSWEIETKEGVYNVVIEKEGYGWRYEYEKTYQNTFATHLYKIIDVSGIYFDDFTFEENKFYKLSGEVVFSGGTNIIIKKANIVAEENASIRILGQVNVEINTGYSVFTSSNNDKYWKGLILESENNIINNLKITKALDGLRFKSNNNTAENIYISFSKRSGIVVTNLIKGNNINTVLIKKQNIGIELNQIDSTNIFQNLLICFADEEGGFLNNTIVNISNCIFYKNKIGLGVYYESHSSIKNCLFEKNKNIGIEIAASNPLIRENQFEGNSDFSIKISIRGYAGPSKPTVNYNNFHNADIFMYILGYQPNPNKEDIDATNNWWSTNYNIDVKIFDKNDLDINDKSYPYTGEIIWEPHLYTPYQIAGIIKHESLK